MCEYMSMMHYSSRRPSRPSKSAKRVAARPELCAHLLGEHIRAARLRDGRPLEEIAPLAALTPAEWQAIEAGQAPDCWEYICLIAAALHMGPSWTPWLVELYAGAKNQ